MVEANTSLPGWSEDLARAILRSLPEERVALLTARAQTGRQAGDDDLLRDKRDKALAELLANPSLRMAAAQAWREAHSDLVAAAQLVSLEGSAEQGEALVRCFGAEAVMLELLTDEHEDAWDVAEWTVENVKSEPLRRELAAILDRWKTGAAGAGRKAPASAAARIVIIGGHQRDESKMAERLLDNLGFDVRWKPCEKCQGSPDDKDLHAAMAHADAVILVISMVSHTIMRIVKRFTQLRRIPLQRIDKATDQQLRGALAELFPDQFPPRSDAASPKG